VIVSVSTECDRDDTAFMLVSATARREIAVALMRLLVFLVNLLVLCALLPRLLVYVKTSLLQTICPAKYSIL
jgi:hypothetical protein